MSFRVFCAVLHFDLFRISPVLFGIILPNFSSCLHV
jgi:hypothetical protein